MTKLFVIVRKDLSASQQTVQAGHAIAQYFIDGNKKWMNHNLVILGVKNLEELLNVEFNLSQEKINFSLFKEPDINNELTAIACDSQINLFKKLKLI